MRQKDDARRKPSFQRGDGLGERLIEGQSLARGEEAVDGKRRWPRLLKQGRTRTVERSCVIVGLAMAALCLVEGRARRLSRSSGSRTC